MAKFYEITGYYLGDEKIPNIKIINIDHIIRMYSDKENKNITYLELTDQLTLAVGHNVKEVLGILNKG